MTIPPSLFLNGTNRFTEKIVQDDEYFISISTESDEYLFGYAHGDNENMIDINHNQ